MQLVCTKKYVDGVISQPSFQLVVSRIKSPSQNSDSSVGLGHQISPAFYEGKCHAGFRRSFKYYPKLENFSICSVVIQLLVLIFGMTFCDRADFLYFPWSQSDIHNFAMYIPVRSQFFLACIYMPVFILLC